jgi:nucleoside-diphosphate-sugar epimerase
MSDELHVIFGSGPAGCWIARALRDRNVRVRVVNRSGKRPALLPSDVEMARADASNADEAIVVTEGADVVYQALSPPYQEWLRLFPGLQAGVLGAAVRRNARYVSVENLYMYDSRNPIKEDSPIAPRSKKGVLRARMAQEVMDAHKRGDVRATILRSSDYYGPGVTSSTMGEFVFGNLLAGKKARVTGSAVLPHSFAYIEDVGRAAAAIGTSESALGKVWFTPHAPAITQGQIVKKAGRAIGIEPKITVVSPLMMRVAGLFILEARASVEMMYEFTEPFVVTSDRTQNEFGVQPTPIDTGIERTMLWYKERAGK